MALTLTDFGSGLVIAKESALGLTALKNIRNGPTTLYGIHIANAGALAYLKLFDAEDVTVSGDGTDADFMFPGAATTDETIIPMFFPEGELFENGLCMLASTGLGTNHTGAPAGNFAVTLFLT